MLTLKKLGASIGIGSAKVDTLLHNSIYHQGEIMSGEIHIHGGNVEQEIDDIHLKILSRYSLDTRYAVDRNRDRIPQEIEIASYRVVEEFEIKPKEILRFPFDIVLPYDTPISFHGCKVWIQTHVDIDDGLDSEDHDELKVAPHPKILKILEAISECGLTMDETDCEYAPLLHQRLPFVQEFTFKPIRKDIAFDQVKVICQHSSNQSVNLILKVDRRGNRIIDLINEQLDIEEQVVKINFHHQEFKQSTEDLSKKIHEMMMNR